MVAASSIRNRILTALSPADFRLLEPHLETVSFPVRHRLEIRNRPIKTAYFPEHGIVSVVAGGPQDKNIEVGIIGWEGMTGLPIVMGTDRSPVGTYVQVDIDGQGIAAEHLCAAMRSSASMQRVFLNFAHIFSVQAAHAALANGRAKIEERLARWLLMALDRANGSELLMTHEVLSIMLGVHRPGVTVALQFLQSQGLIRMERGNVIIVDLQGLTKAAGRFYGGPELEYRRIFGEPPRPAVLYNSN